MAKRVRCTVCGKLFSSRGLGPHSKACVKKGKVPEQKRRVNNDVKNVIHTHLDIIQRLIDEL